jgi:hypothetical protein
MALLNSPAIKATLDPEALSALDQLIIRFPEGARIRLSDGRYATILKGEGEHLERPLVKMLPENGNKSAETEEIDLRQREDLLILEVDASGLPS